MSLCTFQPDIIVPEVKISYKYYFGGGIYTGEGFLFVSHFLGEKDYQIYFNKLLIPVLETEGEVLVSEEHIETYLLSKMDTVPIHLDPIEPYRSKLLYTINQTQDTRNKTQ
ncbi:MAG: hypothetical protein SFU98_17535 [Leptospiraceae bacterium]|nr:hypothetical protein [Leptospiraceae bacterium]